MTTSDTTPTHDTGRTEALCERMIKRLWAINALRSEPVAAAVRAVPRHQFAPEFPLEQVYDAQAVLRTNFDDDGHATSSVSATWVQTLMLERAELQPGMRVLEVGSGGYNAALAAELVGATGTVTSIDIDPAVIDRASTHLAETGYHDRVELVVGDAEHGHPDGAPYDRIIVTVAATDLPRAWTDQLVDGGRLVLPLGVRGFQRIYAFTRHGELLVGETGDHAGFVPMQGLGAPAPTTVPITDTVTLTTDADPVPTPEALPDVFALPAHEQFTGVRIGGMEPFSTLQMWMATGLPHFATLTGTTADFPHRPMTKGLTPAMWDGTSLAYLLLSQVSTAPATYEFVACGHGPGAPDLVTYLVDHVRRWDRDHRTGPGPRFLAHPDLPAADRVIPTRHTRLLALWDQHDTPQLNWDADPGE
ncbi:MULTISPECIES: methyltransferase, FxLD system [unclassified Nocardiopsis]|uniref:methyltransferase, FxLD system n=1 Tax=unclassified Nocardiopsis TaxID=2649073 RepID=UPI001F02AA7B|nr:MULTISPECIES: methyltransferase, FxLD system [unclassified Nocardiopsis]